MLELMKMEEMDQLYERAKQLEACWILPVTVVAEYT